MLSEAIPRTSGTRTAEDLPRLGRYRSGPDPERGSKENAERSALPARRGGPNASSPGASFGIKGLRQWPPGVYIPGWRTPLFPLAQQVFSPTLAAVPSDGPR
jgi:hypothetical protein